MADAVGLDRFVTLGYSLGGAVAQLVGRRHRARLDGLVLVATASHFNVHRSERLSFLGLTGLAAAARVTPARAHRWVTNQLYLQRRTSSWEAWAAQQAADHSWRMVAEAGGALGRFRADDWLGEIDVPTSVVLTTRDQVVPLARQIKMLEAIPGAEAFPVEGGHDAAVVHPAHFADVVTRATYSVLERAR
jgi:3-oxoadipate enol-lactonase